MELELRGWRLRERPGVRTRSVDTWGTEGPRFKCRNTSGYVQELKTRPETSNIHRNIGQIKL